MAPLNFSVQINGPELIKPHTSTPREFKYLSNIDDQLGLRNHIPFIHFYPGNAAGTDPVPIIRRALSMALVPYYPIAGRLRNAENGKLVVDCCGEGVIFREANADVSLAELHKVDGGLKPPFPQWDQLLVDDIWGSFSIVDSPLLRMQDCTEQIMTLYNQWKAVLRIQKFRRIVSYTGFYCFVAVLSYAYTSNTTRAGISRADQYYASYPAGTELLADTAKLYKAALANCFEEEEWGPIEFSIMAKHFERQGKSPYAYHSQYMAHLLSHGQLDGSGA